MNVLAGSEDQARLAQAALRFAECRAYYERVGDVDNVCEMQAFMYWCRKKMNVDTLKDFVASRPPAQQQQAVTVLAVADRQVPVDQAMDFFKRAEAYAKAHADDQLGIAIHFFEVASRFPEQELGRQAQELSLQAMTRFSKVPVAVAQRETIFSRPTVPAAPRRAPVPGAEQVSAAVKTLRQVYAADYGKVLAGGKPTLATSLLKRAFETEDDAVGRYALLQEAMRLAKESESYHAIIQAADAMAAGYAQVDAKAIKLGALDGLTSSLAKAVRSLVTDPSDPSANLTAGTCFIVQGRNLEIGLPCWSRGADPVLAKLAEQEMLKPEGAAQLGELGDGWYEAARRLAKETSEKEFLYSLARSWYQKAMAAGLAGLHRDKAVLRIKELDDLYPPPPSDWSKVSTKQWDRLKGQVLSARASLNPVALIRLAPNQKVRLVPHPTDAWSIFSGAVLTKSGFLGTQAPTIIGGGSGFGAMLFQVDGKPTDALGTVLSGPCQISVALDAIGKTANNTVSPSGAIRVKVVPEE